MAEDILLEKINRGDSDDEASRKILENDTKLKTSILSSHKKADNNNTAIENLEKGVNKSKTDRKEFVNLSMLHNRYNYSNRTEARNDVPAEIRALGQKITYCTASEGWKEEQFTGISLSQWSNTLYWSEGVRGVVYSLGRGDSTYADVQVLNCGGAHNEEDHIIDCGGADNPIK